MTHSISYILLIICLKNVFGDNLSSLTFVIDDTSSMWNDIEAVKAGASDIFDTVRKNKDESQIDNYILVTFNDHSRNSWCDPNEKGNVRAKTKDENVFRNALAAISVAGGAIDCEECSMAGIKRGLEESHPRSNLYIFTDASSKDYNRYEEVNKLALEKQTPIVFVLTGTCGDVSSQKYHVYENVAQVSGGQVFHIDKYSVGKVLEYVKETVKGRLYDLNTTTISAGSHNITFDADELMGQVLFSLSSTTASHPSVRVTGPDGGAIYTRVVFQTDKSNSYAFDVTKSGLHTIGVDTAAKATAKVSVKSQVDFEHGFSSIKLDSLLETSSLPAPDAKTHLLIALNKGDIPLKSVKLLDVNNKLILELPLKILNNATKFYTTEEFIPPKSTFKIAITGYHAESDSTITRIKPTGITIESISPGEIISNKLASVVIEHSPKIIANYSEPLELTCKVEGYPKPDIVWKNSNTGAVFSTTTLPGKDFRYDHINVLSIDKVTENATYSCEANNGHFDTKQVIVEVIRPRYLNIMSTTKDITVEYEKQGVIICTFDAYPLAKVVWYKDGSILTSDDNVEIRVSRNSSIVTIKNSTLVYDGKYTCEAKNEDTKQSVDMQYTTIGLELPKINKTVTNVTILEGSSTTIECKILKGKPRPSISWFFGTTLISPLDRWENQEQVVIPKARGTDSGIYKCEAENEVGIDEHEIKLVVQIPATIIKPRQLIKTLLVGNRISKLDCNAAGVPKPEIKWFYTSFHTSSPKREMFEYNGKSLISLENIQQSHEGNYTCIAKNSAGSSQITYNVNVFELPKINKTVTNVTILEGASTTIECKILKGKPRPSISWIFGTTSISPLDRWENQEQVVIPNASGTDSGIYKCEAENEVGIDEHEIKLVVQIPASIELPTQLNKILIVNDKTSTLFCKAQGVPEPEIKWIYQSFDTGLPSREMIEFKGKMLLNLGNIRLSHKGNYTCIANNSAGSSSITYNVNVFVPATIRKPRQLIKTLLVGNRISKLDCNAAGVPKPEIKWFYTSFHTSSPKREIIEYNGKSLISLENIQPSHEGSYTCIAKNSAGSSHITYNVNVFEEPQIDKSKTKMFVDIGSSAKIDCKILKGRPKPSIRWYFRKGNNDYDSPERFKEVLEFHDQESIILERAAEGNYGTYRCRARNSVTTDYHDIKLTVEYPPKINRTDRKYLKIKIGSKVYLPCFANASPPPKVTWLKDGKELVGDGRPYTMGPNTLRFNAELSVQGYYVCKVSNKFGSDSRRIRVYVTEPISIIKPKTTSYAAPVGSDVNLPCNSTGFPVPIIKWTYQSFDTSKPSETILKFSLDNSLTLKHIQVNDVGYYTCFAANSEDIKNLTYEIQVFAPPAIVNTYMETRFVVVEGDVTLRIDCNATGEPVPTISWRKDNTSLDLGSTYNVIKGTLFINNVPEDAAGLYTCVAGNGRGTALATYEVVVQKYPPFHRTASTIFIEEGISRTIECPLPHGFTDQLRWYKNEVLVLTGELSINDASVRDSGYYSCRVTTPEKSRNSGVEIVVGYAPKFRTDVNEVINMVDGLSVSLDCETYSISKGHITWYHNDEKLDSKDAIYYFPEGLNSPGEYRCEVENRFGKNSRTFHATQLYCVLQSSTLIMNTKNAPLMLSSNLTWLTPEKSYTKMILEKDTQVIFFCPKAFTEFPKKYLTAFCDGGSNFLINGVKYDYRDIKCTDEVSSITQKTERICIASDENTEIVNLGYNVLGETITTVYEVCFNNTSNTPIYAKHTMQNSLADVEYNTVWSDSDLFEINFEEAYECEFQLDYISRYLLWRWFHNVDRCCFSKRQLVSPKDVFPGVPQKSTFSYFNVVPHWSTCNVENWDEIEKRVRNFATNLDSLLVWTGVAGELTLPTRSGPTNILISDLSDHQQAVPLFLWKVIQNPVARSSLAIIQVNVPDLAQSEVSRYTLCRDQCDTVGWMSNPDWQDLTKGYTYCCRLEDFEKAFEFEGIFEPDMYFLPIYTPDYDSY